MLTFSDPQTIEQADHYFQKDMDYYLGASRVLGYITGNAAKSLGVNNAQLTPETYTMHTMLCHGKLGEKKLVSKGAGKKHAAGFDITMADPKELSCMIAYAKAKNHPLAHTLEQAHENAVKNTFAYIERYAGYRKLINGKSTFIRSGKLIASRFHHEISRSDEPHKHDHNFIYNVTVDENGKTVALENRHIFANQDLFHQIWHANLAHELHKIGLQTEITDYKKGTFKIKDFDPDITEYYSKRTKQIEETYKVEEAKLGRELTYEEKEPIKLKLRPKKSKRKIDEIRTEFANDIEERFGFSMEAIAQLIHPNAIQHSFSKHELFNVINQAAEAINETLACFSYEELLKGVLKLTHSKNTTIDIATIEQAIEQHDELIRFSDKTITTKTFHLLEQQIVHDVLNGHDTHTPLYVQTTIAQLIDNTDLTIGQKDAVGHILCSTDLVVAIQGDAGSGKSYALKQASTISSDAIEFQGLAFTGAAADEIERESGIKSTTIHSFLASKSHGTSPNQKRKVWVVDEASMVGSRLLSQLIQRAKEEKAQIVLIGDIKQYQSISAGNIFNDLQNLNVMKTVTMSEVKRQEEQSLIDAVAAINRERDYTKAFDIIDRYKMVKEIEDDEERLNAVVSTYLSSNLDETMLLASTNKDRNTLNTQIRSHLLIQNTIGDECELSVMTSMDIRDIDKSFGQNYQIGQTIIANQQGILGRNGEKGIIVSRDLTNHTITAQKSDGSLHCISLKHHGALISTYQSNNKQFGIGERIMFGRNDKKLGVKNGQVGIIKQMDGDHLLISQQNKLIEIDLKNYPYIDYAYAITDIKAQGKTAKNVIVAASAKRANRESFYVQLTRAKSNLQLFVDDAAKFRIGLEREQSKNSTLQKTIQRIPDARTDIIQRVITAAESNHESAKRSQQKNRHNRVENRSEHGKYGEHQNDNRSDSHNVKRPIQRVGWKLELCRSSGLFTEIDETHDLNRRVNQYPKQQDDDGISMIFNPINELDHNELITQNKLPQ